MKQEYLVTAGSFVVLGIVAIVASALYVPTEFHYPKSEAYIKGAVPTEIEHFESF